MMKKISKYFKQSFIILSIVASQLLSTSANAQSAGDVVTALNQIRATLEAMVQTAAYYIFQTPANIGNTLVTNGTAGTTGPTVSSTVKTLNDQDITNGLAPNTQNPNAALIQLSTIQASDTVLPSTLGVVPFYSSAVHANLQAALIKGNENFNFQSLVTPLAYSTQDMQNNAANYIKFVSGAAIPVSIINLNSYPDSQLKVKDKLDIQNSATYQAFQVDRRQLLAVQSASLSNLYYLYAERMPIPTIQAGDTSLGIASPSALQVENYIATWRTLSPNSSTWYTQMTIASPTNIARETLFVLAEIQAELHRIHLDNERLLALNSINQLQAIQTQKKTLALTEKQIQDQINSKIKQATTQSTVQTTTGQPSAQQQSQAQRLQQTQQQEKSAEQELQQKAK